MKRRGPVRAAAVAALLALAACNGNDGAPKSLRAADGPTTTAPGGAAAGSGYDGTGQGIAGPGPAAGGGATVPGGTGAGSAGSVAPEQAGVPSATGSSGTPTAPGAPTAAGADSAGNPVGPGPTSPAAGTTPPASGGSPPPGDPAAPGSASPAPGGGRADAESGAVSGGTGAAPSTRQADPAAYCQAQRTLDTRLAAIDTDSGPGPLRASVASARAAIGPARDTAPAEVRGDVVVLTDAYEVLFVALDQAGYDVSRLSVGVFEGISPAAIDTATERIAAFVSANC